MLKVEAFVDRISKGNAVIVIDSENKEITVSLHTLNVELKEGDWLNVELSEDVIVSAEVNYELTSEKRKLVSSKLSELRKRKGSKFKN